MVSPLPESVDPRLKDAVIPADPIPITQLEWDSDGALAEHDRQWILWRLIATDPFGAALARSRSQSGSSQRANHQACQSRGDQ